MPRQPSIPDWVDHKEWKKASPNARWNGAQALMAMLGVEGPQSAMALMRGIPNKPPAWVKKGTDLSADGFSVQARRLEAHAARQVAKQAKADRLRAEQNKLCQHEWAPSPLNSSRACSKCGFVEILAA